MGRQYPPLIPALARIVYRVVIGPGYRPRPAGRYGGVDQWLRRFSATLGLTAVLLTACGAPASTIRPPGAAQASQTPQTVKVQVLPGHSLNELWLYVGRDLGIFKRYGIDPQLVSMTPPAAIAALRSGSIDFVTTVGSPVRAIERHPGLLAYRTILVGENHQLSELLAQKGTASVASLRRKVIALGARGGSLADIARTLLRLHGLPAGQYHVVYTRGTTEEVPLLLSGKAQAAMLDMGVAYGLHQQGYPVLASAATEVPFPNIGLGTTLPFLNSHPALVRRVVAASLAALRVTATHSQQVVPVMERDLKLKPAEARALWEASKGVWSTNGRSTAQAIDYAFRTDVRDLHLKQQPTEGDYYDFAYLPSR